MKTQPTFQTAVFLIKHYTLVHQIKCLHIENQIFISSAVFYFAFSYLEMQRRHIKNKIYYRFLTVWKETVHKPTKAVAPNNYFSGEYKCFQ